MAARGPQEGTPAYRKSALVRRINDAETRLTAAAADPRDEALSRKRASLAALKLRVQRHVNYRGMGKKGFKAAKTSLGHSIAGILEADGADDGDHAELGVPIGLSLGAGETVDKALAAGAAICLLHTHAAPAALLQRRGRPGVGADPSASIKAHLRRVADAMASPLAPTDLAGVGAALSTYGDHMARMLHAEGPPGRLLAMLEDMLMCLSEPQPHRIEHHHEVKCRKGTCPADMARTVRHFGHVALPAAAGRLTDLVLRELADVQTPCVHNILHTESRRTCRLLLIKIVRAATGDPVVVELPDELHINTPGYDRQSVAYRAVAFVCAPLADVAPAAANLTVLAAPFDAHNTDYMHLYSTKDGHKLLNLVDAADVVALKDARALAGKEASLLIYERDSKLDTALRVRTLDEPEGEAAPAGDAPAGGAPARDAQEDDAPGRDAPRAGAEGEEVDA